LADKMRMIPGVFYCFFKPTYVNGFGKISEQDIDFNYLQACEGVCRDEFKPIESEMTKTSGNLLVEETARKLFVNSFKRTYNVEFIFNTDMKSFKQKYKHGINADKPILFIYWQELLMNQMIGDF